MLAPKAYCPLWNGTLNRITLSFGDVDGGFNVVIKLNSRVICEKGITPGTEELNITVPNIRISDLTFTFQGKEKYNYVAIDKIYLGYCKAENCR